MSRARRPVRVLAAAAALLLPVAGCSLLEPDTQPTGLGPGNTAPPAGTTGLERFYEQQLDWGPCERGDGECAELEVPMDYEQPDGRTLEIAVLRVPAKDEAAGSLVVNPGGPGGSGVDYAAAADFIVSDQIRRHFDVVGFDPRGVGRSEPIDCLSDAEMDDYLAKDPTPDTPEEKAAGERAQQDFADGCEAKSGELLGHVSTADAARDMDVLRAVLGDGKLTYLGKSYGTYLGTIYADLFPDRVGRLVLDGVLPPDATSEEVAIGQAKGFDTATRAWAQDCVDDDCPLGSSADEVVEHVRDDPASARHCDLDDIGEVLLPRRLVDTEIGEHLTQQVGVEREDARVELADLKLLLGGLLVLDDREHVAGGLVAHDAAVAGGVGKDAGDHGGRRVVVGVGLGEAAQRVGLEQRGVAGGDDDRAVQVGGQCLQTALGRPAGAVDVVLVGHHDLGQSLAGRGGDRVNHGPGRSRADAQTVQSEADHLAIVAAPPTAPSLDPVAIR